MTYSFGSYVKISFDFRGCLTSILIYDEKSSTLLSGKSITRTPQISEPTNHRFIAPGIMLKFDNETIVMLTGFFYRYAFSRLVVGGLIGGCPSAKRVS